MAFVFGYIPNRTLQILLTNKQNPVSKYYPLIVLKTAVSTCTLPSLPTWAAFEPCIKKQDVLCKC